MGRPRPPREGAMAHYAAFDVSDKDTAIHVLDEHGKPVWKGKRPSEPEALAAALKRHAPELVRVGLETGRLAPWLYHSLKALGVPAVCLDARHARAATAPQRNKPTRATPRRWRSWCARAGTGRRGSRAGPRTPCVIWSAPAPSWWASRPTCPTRSAAC